MGHLEGETQRMVTTPWFDHEIPMSEAAEIGTRKVIAEHSTIGIVITTDGTITEIPREDYLEAEDRVITELKELGKPFLVLLNSAYPNSERAQAIQADISQRYGVACRALNCLELSEGGHQHRPEGCALRVPGEGAGPVPAPWVDALRNTPSKPCTPPSGRGASDLYRIRDVGRRSAPKECEEVSDARRHLHRLGTGTCWPPGWTCPGPVLPHSVPAVRLPDPGRRGSAQPADPAGQGQGRL